MAYNSKLSTPQIEQALGAALLNEKNQYNITQDKGSNYPTLAEAIAAVSDDKYKVNGIVLTYNTGEEWVSMRYNGEDASGFSDEQNWSHETFKADDEDLEQTNGLMKFKDRKYDEANFSGKGYKILRKNIQKVSVPKFDLTISSGCTSDGNITITIGDNPVEVAVTTAAATAEDVAALIGAAVPDVTVEGAVVTFKSNPTVDYSTTGVTGEVADNTYTENRNVLTQEMMNEANTVYEIRYDFDLNGAEITVPEGCVLKFDGGKISNGVLIFNNTYIVGYSIDISECILRGNILNKKINTNDFLLSSNINILNQLIGCMPDDSIIYIKKGKYFCICKNENDSGILVNNKKNFSIVMDSECYIYMNPNNLNKQYSIINILNSEKIKIINGNLIGDREYHDYSLSGTHEFGHGIVIDSSVDVLLNNINISKCTGDGIITWGINSDNLYNPCRNINISNILIDNVRRNGISIVLGEYIHINECTILNTGQIDDNDNEGAFPKTGIDIEGGSRPKYIFIKKCNIKDSNQDSINSFNGNHVYIYDNIVDAPILYQGSSNINIFGNEIRNKGKSYSNRSAIGRTNKLEQIGPGTMLATETKYKIISCQTIDFTSVGSSDNNPGTVFICNKAKQLGDGDYVMVVLENICIYNNNIIDFESGITACSESDNGSKIFDNSILNSTIGIYMFDGICSRNIIKNSKTGIRVNSGSRVSISNNDIMGCTNRAIYCILCDNLLCDNNNILVSVGDYAVYPAIEVGSDVKNSYIYSNTIKADGLRNDLLIGGKFINNNILVNEFGRAVNINDCISICNNTIISKNESIYIKLNKSILDNIFISNNNIKSKSILSFFDN